MSPSLLLHALRTQLSMLLALSKEANTPAEMSLSNETFSDVFPAIQITVDRGSSSNDREGNTSVIPQRYSRLKTKKSGNFCEILNHSSRMFSRNSFPGEEFSDPYPLLVPSFT